MAEQATWRDELRILAKCFGVYCILLGRLPRDYHNHRRRRGRLRSVRYALSDTIGGAWIGACLRHWSEHEWIRKDGRDAS